MFGAEKRIADLEAHVKQLEALLEGERMKDPDYSFTSLYGDVYSIEQDNLCSETTVMHRKDLVENINDWVIITVLRLNTDDRKVLSNISCWIQRKYEGQLRGMPGSELAKIVDYADYVFDVTGQAFVKLPRSIDPVTMISNSIISME